MMILEICQKQPFDIIGMTPRGSLGLCCVHIAQLMTHLAIYTLPLNWQLCYKPLGILERVTKSQKAHISSHDKLQKLHNIKFAWDSSWGFLKERVEKEEVPPSPVIFLKIIKNTFPGIWESIYHIKWGAGMKFGFSYQDTLWTFLL